MISYNTTALDNRYIQDEAESAMDKACITPEELAAIKEAYPSDLYSPNMYIRFGIFILTLIIVLFSFGILCLTQIDNGSETGFGVICLFCGIVTYVIGEVMVKEKRHYKSGADAALIWSSGGFILSGFMIITEVEAHPLVYCLLTLLLASWFVLRFADVSMTIVMHGALLASIFSLLIDTGTAGKVIIPFAVMIVSLAVYLLALKLSRTHACRHYTNCLDMWQCLALLTLYAGGNYFIVRELSIEMFNLDLQPGQDIAGGWLFWILTIALPLVYIGLGIRKKNRILIGIGLILIAAMVYTIRYYHSIAPLEVAMTLGGIGMIAVAYGLIRYLKVARHGFTADSSDERHTMEAVQIESLIIAQTMSQAATPPADQYNLGGGTGGGGGASGEY